MPRPDRRRYTAAMSIAVGEGAVSANASAWSLRRIVTAGVIGNVLEWYDFAVYGFFAPILAAQFFPAGDPVVSLLAAFAAFAVGFLMRPVGAMLFGYIGDRYGRARALILSIAMMAIPTVLMGLLPTYAMIGVAASVLIVILRMFQGMAVGGEFTSSIVFLAENAPQKRRGFVASFAMFGATFGTMLGSAVGGALSNVLSPEALASWGWRAAFISGIAVAVVGIVLRRNMLDGPAAAPSESPLVVAFRDHKRAVARVFVLNMGTATVYYTLFVYAATWVADKTPLERAAALDITTLTILTFLVVLPTAAWVSDRVGRKLVMALGMSACVLLAFPLISAMHAGTSAIAIAAAQMTFGALLALSMAPQPAAMCEMFPHGVRVSAVSVGYGLAYALFGGTAPLVAVWLIARSGSDVAFAWYLALVMALSLLVALVSTDRRTEPLA
jgi:MHS family proline/betaine transporter-like MFS transporter